MIYRYLILFVILGLAASACAETATLNSVADATLIQMQSINLPPNANGSGQDVFVGVTQRSGERRGLIRFDVGSIPANAIIQSATLRLYLTRSQQETTNLKAHRLLNSWGEGSSSSLGGQGFPASTGDSTWIYRFFNTTQSWVRQGGDFNETASGSIEVNSVTDTWYEINSNGIKADVQTWLEQPANNYGWILIGDGTIAKAYASRENITSSIRPQLVVTWTPATTTASSGDVPFPWWAMFILSLGLIGIGFRLNKRIDQ